jgi:hypothetical protein
MDDIDRQFPYPRFLRVPFIFIPKGTPEGPEGAAFKAAHPGWVKFPAAFVPRPQPALDAEAQPEPAVSEQPQAEPWSLETPGPDARPWPGHLRQIPRPTRSNSGNRLAGPRHRSSAPPPVPFPPPVPPPRRPIAHTGEMPDSLQKRGIGLLINGKTPDELGSLLRDLDPVGTAQAAETLDKGQRESVAPPISGGASRADSTGKRTRLAQAVEGEMPVEPPVKPVEGEGANPGPGTLPEVVAPETASTPAPKPPSEVAPVPQPAAPVEAAPEEVRVRGDVKGGLPAPEARSAAEAEAKNAARQRHFERGRQFQTDALKALGISAKAKRITTTFADGSSITVVPDAVKGETIIEAKDVVKLSNSKQFRGYAGTGRPIELVVSPNTKSIAMKLQELIKSSKGTIRVFDPTTGRFSSWTE